MLCLKDYEDYAKEHLDRRTWAFYSQGAEREETYKENLRSFTRYTLIPRMLRNKNRRDLSVTVLGEKISIPIGISPTAYQRLAHPEGEMAASRAAGEMNTVYALSTVSNTSIEEISRHRQYHSPLWMQILALKDRHFTKELIKKAEAHGFKAIVLTVDTPVPGLQLKMWKNGLAMPPHISIPNVADAIKKLNDDAESSDHVRNVNFFADTLTWEDVSWIKSLSSLPLVLKGILTAKDALLAVKHGASAVWVSNHGGRQLDGVNAALDALPEISAALAGTGCEIYMDGGIRWGSDVFKALALGATATFVGRPALWGLAHSGQDGVRHVLQILKSELDRTMHLAGCSSIEE
ncbi:Hydroxyacid oxidase 1, partial [Stegodyphus mimosarum]